MKETGCTGCWWLEGGRCYSSQLAPGPAGIIQGPREPAGRCGSFTIKTGMVERLFFQASLARIVKS